MNDTGSFPRSSGSDKPLKNGMEERDEEEASTSSQGPGYRPANIPENRDLEKMLQESSRNQEKTSPNPELKTPPLPLSDLGQPRKSPLTGTDKKYPIMKQRGFYSDILSPGTLDQLGVSMAAVHCQPRALHAGSGQPLLCPAQCQLIGSLPSCYLSIYPSVLPPTHPPHHPIPQSIILQFLAKPFLWARPRTEHWRRKQS